MRQGGGSPKNLREISDEKNDFDFTVAFLFSLKPEASCTKLTYLGKF